MPSSDREAIRRIASRVREGDRRALSQALSFVEDQTEEGRGLLDLLFDPEPRAHRLGVTGPPGSGKSTIVHELTRLLRARGETVGILAVDPSSPFTGGAILGDRIRMQAHAADPGVFIRSMASRGSLGGLASTTYEATEILEAAGCAWIIVETVGVGQSEMEVVETTDTTVLVLVPESGDAVQVMKAGVMEGGDVFVINKYDREGGDRLHKEIALMLELARAVAKERRAAAADPPQWERRICKTVAARGEGVDGLLDAIDAHRAFLSADPHRAAERRGRRIARRLRTQLRDRLLRALWQTGEIEAWIEASRDKAQQGDASPYALVDEMVQRLIADGRVARIEESGGEES